MANVIDESEHVLYGLTCIKLVHLQSTYQHTYIIFPIYCFNFFQFFFSSPLESLNIISLKFLTRHPINRLESDWVISEDEKDCCFLLVRSNYGSGRLLLSMFRTFYMAILTRCVGYPLFTKCLYILDAAFS